MHRGTYRYIQGTNPIAAQLRKEIADKFSQDAHWQYWNFRNYLQQYEEEQELLSTIDIDKEIATLPAKLREEVQVLKHTPLPEMITPEFHFSEQYQICLPQD